ncbi:type VI secretion system-associated protein TagF (plasmid) [Rhizobium sullae]|uniref:Type VI secretion system-associated protein TagF n=1 Tax=Rhizobium sullae TaxID=50338 RepID=A0A2N0DBK3_RHISU|nr:type VI secretion system-associated protein TagF [Rhizobium sullae]PKA43460.1 type VI secretion system-associated protein TagF [Rhizobium sullae]UWU16567.1 type VI secretion system-associated protein TagF [Rhizobium sullae]
MSDATVILPGFFGKLPAMGDFVTRGLTASFVGPWDRWITRHLVHRFSEGSVSAHLALRFILGPEAFGPMTGVVMASADRAGRRFPLTIAAVPPTATTEIATLATDWLDALEAAGKSARDGEMDSDGLAARLGSLPYPAIAACGAQVRRMTLWMGECEAVEVDPGAPEAALRHLFPEGLEAG